MMPLQYRLPFPDTQAGRLRHQLVEMTYGDSLESREWRVEYLRQGRDSPYFKVFWGGEFLGCVVINSKLKLEALQWWLADWLIAQGWRNDGMRRTVRGAKTSLSARFTGLPRLLYAEKKPVGRWMGMPRLQGRIATFSTIL